MTKKSPLALELELRMEEKGFTPTGLSLRAHLNQTYVRDILSGRVRHPRIDNLRRLAAALECSVADLTGSRDDESGTTSPDLAILELSLTIADRLLEREPAAVRARNRSEMAVDLYDWLAYQKKIGRSVPDVDEAIARIGPLMQRRILR